MRCKPTGRPEDGDWYRCAVGVTPAEASAAPSSGRQGAPQGEAQGAQGLAKFKNDQQSRQSLEAAAPPPPPTHAKLRESASGDKPTYQASAAASNASTQYCSPMMCSLWRLL